MDHLFSVCCAAVSLFVAEVFAVVLSCCIFLLYAAMQCCSAAFLACLVLLLARGFVPMQESCFQCSLECLF